MPVEETCKKPFINSDFASFDKVADGRLYLSEVDYEQLDCIVDHLIYTKDQEVRDEFLSMIQNDLWEAIREELLLRKKDDSLPKDVQERIKYLLGTDYSKHKFIYSVGPEYEYDIFTLSASQGEDDYRFSVQEHMMVLHGKIDGRFDINEWKLAPFVYLAGYQFWTFQDEQIMSSTESMKDDYRGVWGGAAFNAFKRDESIKMSANFMGGYYHNPPPGLLKKYLDVVGDVNFQGIGKTPLSAKASLHYNQYDITPISEDLFDPEFEKLTVDSEISYMFKKAGLLLEYSHEYEDVIREMIAHETNMDSGSLLAHIAIKNGFIRFGAGGGYWNEKGKLIGGEPHHSSGAEVHGDVQLQWSPVAPLSLVLSSSVYGNHSEGTFVGWFPSAVGRLDANLALGDLFLNVGGGVEGFYRDLNLYQKMIQYSVHTNISYAPVDYFNASLGFEYTNVNQKGYDKYNESIYTGSSAINYRVLKEKPDLWIKFDADIEKIDHKTPSNQMDTLAASIGTTLFLKYQGM